MVGLLPRDRFFAAVAFLVTGLLAMVFDLSSRDCTARFFTARLLGIGCLFVDFTFFALGADLFAAFAFLGAGFDLVWFFLVWLFLVWLFLVCFFLVFFLAAIRGVYHRRVGAVLLNKRACCNGRSPFLARAEPGDAQRVSRSAQLRQRQ